MLKAVMILGPNMKGPKLEEIKSYYKQPGFLLIGDGESGIPMDKLEALRGNIDLTTRIDIYAHGNKGANGQHFIFIYGVVMVEQLQKMLAILVMTQF